MFDSSVSWFGYWSNFFLKATLQGCQIDSSRHLESRRMNIWAWEETLFAFLSALGWLSPGKNFFIVWCCIWMWLFNMLDWLLFLMNEENKCWEKFLLNEKVFYTTFQPPGEILISFFFIFTIVIYELWADKLSLCQIQNTSLPLVTWNQRKGLSLHYQWHDKKNFNNLILLSII